MSITNEKLQTIKDNVSKVYHSGQMDVIKNANSLKGFESNKAILLDDVSPVTHEMGVRVRGKNLLNLSNREIVTNTWSPNTDMRNFNGNQLFVGISANNYFITPNIVSYSIGETIKVTAIQAAYGLGYDVAVEPNTSYVFSSITTNGEIRAGLYNKDGTFSRMIDAASTFTTKSTEYWAVVVLKQLAGNESIEASFSNIQLELGATATSYTPYVPDLTAVKVSRYGKNILEYPYVETTLTRNGITFTDNGDGTITANGTATADTQFRLQDTVVYPDNYNPFKYLIGKIIGVTGSPDGSSKDTYAIQSIQTGNYGNTGFTISNSNRYRFAIFIKSGITVSNLVFKPMIYLRDVTNLDYEFYNRADYTPTSDGIVNGVTSLYPNTTLMTDTDGVIIYCNYYKDVDKAYNKLSAAIALSGGE